MMETFDIVIVGAGPAGLCAAVAAAENAPSLRILLIDDNVALGGQIWRQGPGVTLPAVARRLLAAINELPNIDVALKSRVVMLESERLLLEAPACGRYIGYRQILLCTGARERFLPFPGWTLPGVTGIGGLQSLLKGGLPVKGERLVIAGSGPLLLAAAASARKAGADVVAIAEQASFSSVVGFGVQLLRWPEKLIQAAKLYSPRYQFNSYLTQVLGDKKIEAVQLKQGSKALEIECDRVACGFGLLPNLQLAQALNCQIEDDHVYVDEFQRTSVDGCYAAGESTGFGGCEKAMIEGRIAGLHMAEQLDGAASLIAKRQHWQLFGEALNRSFALRPELLALYDDETLLCRCEDVRVKDVVDLSGWIEAKLMTRCGMGACQGRTCSAAAQTLWGWTPPTPRPPYSPARIETLALLPDRVGK